VIHLFKLNFFDIGSQLVSNQHRNATGLIRTTFTCLFVLALYSMNGHCLFARSKVTSPKIIALSTTLCIIHYGHHRDVGAQMCNCTVISTTTNYAKTSLNSPVTVDMTLLRYSRSIILMGTVHIWVISIPTLALTTRKYAKTQPKSDPFDERFLDLEAVLEC